MTERLAKIELSKEYMKFSAAHFTIFNARERERLHGHNFQVSATIEAPVDGNGMCFSYRIYKDKIRAFCEQLDEYLLLPEQSPHLKVSEQGDSYAVEFNTEKLLFARSDTLLLPIRNATVEELSHYLLSQLVDAEDVEQFRIRSICVRVSSGAGQWGSSEWVRGTGEGQSQ